MLVNSLVKKYFNLDYIKGFFINIKSKLEVKSPLFILFITIYFGFALNLSFWRFVFERISIDSFGIFVFFISLIFFILVPLYMLFNLIVLPYIAKPFVIVLLIASSSVNYFMYNYGVFIDADMIRNVFETNTREAFDLITFKSFLYVFFTGIVPAIVVFFTKIKYSSFLKELKIRSIFVGIGLLIVAMFAIVSYKEYASFGRNNREVRKLINTFNYNYAVVRYFQLQSLSKREFLKLDENAKLNPYEDPYKTVLVLVVGETARAKNFSLYGYKKETNPLLEKEDVIAFKNVKSCGTATAISLPCIFSSKTKNDFNVVDAKYVENLIDILANAGYDILWLENDDGCKGVCNRITTEYMVEQNNKKYCDGTYCLDEVLIDGLEERLKNISKDTVIVLHGMGSHGPTYYKRYTKEFEKFKPTCDTAEIQNCSLEAIRNTYDNTIVYTDFILSLIINVLKKFPNFESGMLYVSDHGESLGENNIYLHGLPYKIAPSEQTDIPMILWMSENMKRDDHIDYKCLKEMAEKNNYSHDNVFHSISSLLEVETTTYNNEFDIFKSCRTKALPY